MERLIPSDQWHKTAEKDREIETELDKYFSFDNPDRQQSDNEIHLIQTSWIKHGIAIGDPSVKEVAAEFFDEPMWDKLVIPSVNYQKEKKT